MKVKVLCDLSDHQRSYVGDEEVEMDSAQAARWIAAGWARSLEIGVVETATMVAGHEQAVQPSGRRGKPA